MNSTTAAIVAVTFVSDCYVRSLDIDEKYSFLVEIDCYIITYVIS